jgi:hypothetical protein
VNSDEAITLTMDVLLPTYQAERQKLDDIDRWARWDHDDPHKPAAATSEYKELIARSQAQWGDLVVGSVAQTLYVEGYRRPDAPNDSTGWDIWQANGMDGRQVALHRAVLCYGLAYGLGLPGKTLGGGAMPKMRGVSPRDMIAVYEDPADDEWPALALVVRKVRSGHVLRLIDDDRVYRMRVKDLGDKPDGVEEQVHGLGVTPVVRYTNRMDLEGRSAGEIEPFIPLLGKIDQTSFDRLVVQRFGSWIVRVITGLDAKATADANGINQADVTTALKVNDIITLADHESKVSSLPATPLDGFIKAHESDLMDLAAVSQTPAFEMLGQMANLSAEALAAAKASQTAKSDERKHTLGEQHEQFIRLASYIAGDRDGAADFSAQVRWADTSIRSLAQAADAYGKMVTQLGLPPEVLWPKVPGMTQQDVDEALALAAQRNTMANLLAGIDLEPSAA